MRRSGGRGARRPGPDAAGSAGALLPQWVMDVLVCNGLGIYCGMKTLKWLSLKTYKWQGLWNIPTYKYVSAWGPGHLWGCGWPEVQALLLLVPLSAGSGGNRRGFSVLESPPGTCPWAAVGTGGQNVTVPPPGPSAEAAACSEWLQAPGSLTWNLVERNRPGEERGALGDGASSPPPRGPLGMG